MIPGLPGEGDGKHVVGISQVAQNVATMQVLRRGAIAEIRVG